MLALTDAELAYRDGRHARPARPPQALGSEKLANRIDPPPPVAASAPPSRPKKGSNHSSDLLPKADLRLRFDGTRPSSGSNGTTLRLSSAVVGTQAMQFNACEFGAQFGDETEAPPST